MVWTKTILNTALASALAGGFLLLGGATTVRANDDESCRRNVDKWEDKLERDVHRYGNYSRQANHDRHELGEARESCERHHDYNRRDHYDYDRDGDRR
jgi:Ni/Co efflux regulator RcnB